MHLCPKVKEQFRVLVAGGCCAQTEQTLRQISIKAPDIPPRSQADVCVVSSRDFAFEPETGHSRGIPWSGVVRFCLPCIATDTDSSCQDACPFLAPSMTRRKHQPLNSAQVGSSPFCRGISSTIALHSARLLDMLAMRRYAEQEDECWMRSEDVAFPLLVC